MMDQHNKKAIYKALEQICSHALFVNSNTYIRLLKFLVEKALTNEDLKEYTIGSELFGIDYSKDRNNGTVRSYMYKLRKKLDTFYESTEPDSNVVFHLEKGQYNLSFLTSKQYKSNRQDSFIRVSKRKLTTATTILLLSLTIVLVVFNYPKTPNRIWKPFFTKNAKNLVIVSDQYIVSQKLNDGSWHGVMYGDINNNNDLLNFNQQHPNLSIRNTDYTLMSKMAPFGIKLITEWFMTNKSNFDLQLESKFTFDDVRENNILFIGQFKTMNTSNSLFLRDSKVFSTYKDGFKYKFNNKEKIYNTKFSPNGKVEYAMVSCNSYSDNKYALYFVSNNDIGVIATLRKFSDKIWAKEFENKLRDNSVYFNALFEVRGLQRTDVSCKLVELETFKN